MLVFFIEVLNLDLTTEFNHTVGWNLIEVTHRTGIPLHRDKELFTPRRHTITHGTDNPFTRYKEADLH